MKFFNVVVPCNDKDTAEIVKAEIKHKLGYHANIEEVAI